MHTFVRWGHDQNLSNLALTTRGHETHANGRCGPSHLAHTLLSPGSCTQTCKYKDRIKKAGCALCPPTIDHHLPGSHRYRRTHTFVPARPRLHTQKKKKTYPEVVDEVVRVGVRLPPHRRRLHVDELHARQQIVRLAANQLEDEVAGPVADIFQNLKMGHTRVYLFQSEDMI